jgi:hypothetical protein
MSMCRCCAYVQDSTTSSDASCRCFEHHRSLLSTPEKSKTRYCVLIVFLVVKGFVLSRACDFVRRSTSVIGTLLGSVNAEGVVDVRDSFPVPFTEVDTVQIRIVFFFRRLAAAVERCRELTRFLLDFVFFFFFFFFFGPVLTNSVKTISQVAVDMQFHRTMMELYSKSSPTQKLVGW